MKYIYLFTLITFCSLSLRSQDRGLYEFLTSIDNSSVLESIKEEPIRTFTLDFGSDYTRKVTVDFSLTTDELINSFLVRFENPIAKTIIDESLKDPRNVNYIKQMDYLNEDGSTNTSFIYNIDGLSQYATFDEKGNKTIRIFEEGNVTEVFQTTNSKGKVIKQNEFNGYSKIYHTNNVFTTGNNESTGQIAAEGERVNGLKTGVWKFYHPNGELESECTYSDGLIQDYCKSYNDDGSLQKDFEVVMGGQRTSIYYSPSGKVRASFEVSHFVRNGSAVIYSENGNKEAEGSFKNDLRHGLWKMYTPNGVLAMEAEYLMDKPHGTLKYFDKEGNVAQTEEYLYGFRVK